MNKLENKQIGINIYFVMLISITAFMVYATFWKMWIPEDTFWTFIYIVWPAFGGIYMGAMKPGVAQLFSQFMTLVFQYLQRKITADELVQRLVILIKNAVLMINDVQGIDGSPPDTPL